MNHLQATLEQYPRENLTRTPTPLDMLPKLGDQLGLNLYLKRDDLTDLTLGGDKPRKLEYEIAQACLAGADTLVTCGSMQSNHARLTTAAARKVGMECVVVLSRDQWAKIQGNLLSVYLMGAQVEIVDVADHWDLEESVLTVCKQLRAAGKRPHYIPISGTTPHSCLGYIRGTLETLSQLPQRGQELDAFYVPCGTGGIFTATLLTLREMGVNCPVIGISVNRDEATCRDNLETWWGALCNLLDCDLSRDRGEYEIHANFIGREYGDPTEACLDAIIKLGSAEGILLDPVYSGKVMSGLLAHHAAGRWPAGSTIVMLHSGGVPALFAYHDVIEAHLKKRGIVNQTFPLE